MLDKHNEIDDRRLANHIVSLYAFEEDEEMEKEDDNDEEEKSKEKEKEKKSKKKSKKRSAKKKEDEDTINMAEENKMDIDEINPPEKISIKKEVLTAYISEARKLNPKISDNVVNELINHYLKMRENGGKNTISATPRQLESLIRLSEARARLRFSPFVEKEDVEEAVNLIKVATQQAATDPVTGVIDMDMLQTGITSSSRARLSQLIEIIKTILIDYQENARKGVKFNSLGDEVRKRVNELGQLSFNFSDFDYRDALRKLEDENIVAILGSKNMPTIRLIARDF
jgi:DNA replication licensing factor MCM4